MEDARTEATEKKEEHAAGDQPVIHRVCEACNNMFATHPGSKHQRCPKCTKD